MLFLAKAALGFCGALTLTGAYVFHEGVIRVDVDQNCSNGSHVHLFVPATVVPVGLRVVPFHHLERAAAQARPFLPAIRELSKELQKYPNAELRRCPQWDQSRARHSARRKTVRRRRDKYPTTSCEFPG